MGFGDRFTGKGSLLWGGANLGRAIVTNGDFTAYVCDSAATRPSFQFTLGRLVQLLTDAREQYDADKTLARMVISRVIRIVGLHEESFFIRNGQSARLLQ